MFKLRPGSIPWVRRSNRCWNVRRSRLLPRPLGNDKLPDHANFHRPRRSDRIYEGLEGRETMIVRNETRGSVLGECIDLADTSRKRQKGLLGRSGLAAGHGLWIVPCESIHTFGMRFPIDVVYLDRKKRVRKVRRAMRPWRLSMCSVAHSVLELPIGVIDQTLTQKGDQLHFSEGGG
jgi:uncharacterized membrane protein (UPF0127 family)